MQARVCLVMIAAALSSAVSGAQAQSPPPIAVDAAAPCRSITGPARYSGVLTPQSPPLAVQQAIAGTVIVDVQLDTNSHVMLASVVQTPSAILNSSALAALRTVKFTTTTMPDCSTQRSSIRVPVVFPKVTAPGPVPASVVGFIGTWTCDSQRLARVVDAYGRNVKDGHVVVMLGAFVDSAKIIGSSAEFYSQSGAVTTVSSMFGARLFIGTSRGWNGDRLVFDGASSSPQMSDPPVIPSLRPAFQRLTYTRVDADHFTRVYEMRSNEDDPWAKTAFGTCTRVTVPAIS